MILVQASHIAKQFDGKEVLKDASLVVQSGERVGFIGNNGAGKSTLLRILIGEYAADSGSVSLAKGATMGYVAQFRVTDDSVSVFDFAAESFADLFAMEVRLRAMETEMAKPDVHGDEAVFRKLTEDYDVLRHEFEDRGGYGAEARIRRVLDGLQFPKEVHRLPVGVLSGGQKTRLALAKLLVSEPDVLVLDEPTNYLDTDTMDWLESYLISYRGAVLLVSHDRYFLDHVATSIVELENGCTTSYTGNYESYMEQKSANLEADIKRYEAQQEEIKRIETFVQKNIVRASTTKRAQSRRKLLEKMVRLERPSESTPKLALRFTCHRESGKDVLTSERLVFGYPDKPMTGSPLDLYVARGQRLAILGPNGIGKTTLLRTLVGELQPISGDVHWGQHVSLGYYDQEQTHLIESKTVLDLIWDEHPSLDITTIRTALGRFLFRGESVNSPVATLSGGEKSRLALCQLMMRQPNVLVMDEPTNHLDLLAKEVLEDALEDYEGTILMVSHDRYFIDAIATHILTLDADAHKLYIGNYSEYVQKRNEDEKWAQESELENVQNSVAKGRVAGARDVTANVAETSAGMAEKPRVVRSADVRRLRDKIEACETRIAKLEARQAEIGELFLNPDTMRDGEKVASLQDELAKLGEEHDAQMEQWEALSLELDSLA